VNPPQPKLINGMPVVAVCTRCGREFLGMPRDGIDHYGVRVSGYHDHKTCGGRVVMSENRSASDIRIIHR
jgi:hypothetical protein